MKSEKAKSFIDRDAVKMGNGDVMVDVSTAYTAVDLAEQEAEQRMQSLIAERDKYKALYENDQSAVETSRIATMKLHDLHDKAVEGFIASCLCDNENVFTNCDECGRLKNFIQKMDEK